MHRECVDLPIASHPGGNPHCADVAERLRHGEAIAALLEERRVERLLDISGSGLAFRRRGDGSPDLQLLHESARVLLCSHFIDPLVTAFQGLDWSVVWQSLQSAAWVKAVWDRVHALELQRFGVPQVLQLRMAAPDRAYDRTPLDPARQRPVISFVGTQNSGYFRSTAPLSAPQLFAGALAQAVRGDLGDMTFYDIYHDLYGLGEPVAAGDDLQARIRKTATYFQAKMFFHAALCLRNRDRFVIFLKRHLGNLFQLVGNGWDAAYGFSADPPLPTYEAYLQHFRDSAVNLNLVNGNAESGLNMRHFEITAAGGFLLCYQQPEVGECFEIGRECAVFRDERDLLEKIRYYLAHGEERAAIAHAGQQRTLGEHLYSHRLGTLLGALEPRPLPVAFSARNWREDFAELVPEPDIILDCGANVGQMAEAYRQFYPRAAIYSFEPVGSAFEKLREKCAALGVTPVRKAVGDRDGKAWINLTAGAESNSLLEFLPGNPCERWHRVVGREEIEICTLDRWCKDNGVDPRRVSIIKMDLQGAELKALYGARELLSCVKLLLVEVSFVPLYKDCPLFEEVDRFIAECGFRRRAVYASDQPHNWGDALYYKPD